MVNVPVCELAASGVKRAVRFCCAWAPTVNDVVGASTRNWVLLLVMVLTVKGAVPVFRRLSVTSLVSPTLIVPKSALSGVAAILEKLSERTMRVVEAEQRAP